MTSEFVGKKIRTKLCLCVLELKREETEENQHFDYDDDEVQEVEDLRDGKYSNIFYFNDDFSVKTCFFH